MTGHTSAGDLICTQEADGTVTVVSAPRYARFAISVLTRPGLMFIGDCVVVGGAVWYQPVAFADGGQVLVCKLVRDDREWGAVKGDVSAT